MQGETVTEPARIKTKIVKFYRKLYTEEEEWRPAGNISNCPTISKAEEAALQEKFDEQEMYNCLKL